MNDWCQPPHTGGERLAHTEESGKEKKLPISMSSAPLFQTPAEEGELLKYLVHTTPFLLQSINMTGRGKQLVPRLNFQLEGLSPAISNNSPRNAQEPSRHGSTSIPTPRTQTKIDQRSRISSQLPLPTPRGGISYAQALATPRGGGGVAAPTPRGAAPTSTPAPPPPPHQPVVVAFIAPTSQPPSVPAPPPPPSIPNQLSRLQHEQATIHTQTSKLQTAIHSQQTELQSRLTSISDLAKTRDHLASQVSLMQELCHQAAGVEEVHRGEVVAQRLLLKSLQATIDIHRQRQGGGEDSLSRDSTRNSLIGIMTIAARQLELDDVEKMLVDHVGSDVESAITQIISGNNKKTQPSARLSQQFMRCNTRNSDSGDNFIIRKRLDSIHIKLHEVESALGATTAIGEGHIIMI